MVAYVLADTKITNPEAYEEYKTLARPLVEKHGGKYLARGGDMHVDDSDLWQPSRLVLIEFPDIESARAFTDSDEYAPIKARRRANAESTLVIFDGI